MVETSLTLSPPGEKEENEVVLKSEDHDDEGKCAVETEETCLLTIMQRMIAQEVRNYVDSLRAEDGPTSFGLQSAALQNDP